MPEDFWAGVGFALRQAVRWEVFGVAAVELLCTALVYAAMVARGEEIAWLDGRESGEAKLLEFGLRLLFWPLTIALLSRLNRRIFGRPFPVGPIHGAFRALKAQLLFGLVMAFWILLPVAIGIVLMSHLPQGPSTEVIGAVLGVGAVVAGLWLILSKLLYFPMILYEGRGAFFRAQTLLEGRRLRLAAMIVVVVLAGFAWTAAVAFIGYGLFGPLSLIGAGVALVLLYGPLDALLVGFYLDGLAREDAATGQPALA
jgi:hypothetical protein